MKTLSHSILSVLLFKILFFAVASSVFSSCSNKYEDVVVKKIESYFGDTLADYDEIVIIPGAGCTGCISQAESYFLKNVSKDRSLFIFTYLLSQKSLYMRLGRDNLVRDNVLIDTTDWFYVSHFHDNIYPYILKVENGQVVDVKSL